MRNRILLSLALILLGAPANAATTIPLTVNLSEAVAVTGSPRIAVDVGGTTRYATYTSGSGTNALTFTLSPQAGDVDLDGITVSSPIYLNGGSIKDTAGNDATLTFTPPNTTGIKIDYPSLSMDFVTDADGRYTLNGTAYNDLTSFLTAASGTFSRASIGTYYDSAGILQTASAETPRFDWDPVTHAAKGLLIEESRTNLLTYSTNMNNALWTLAGGTKTTGGIAPDGSSTATYFSGPSTPTTASRGAITATSTSMTYSVYAKYVSGGAVRNFLLRNQTTATNFTTCNFNLQTGTISSACSGWTISAIGNGWYRLTYPQTSGIAVGDSLAVYYGNTGAAMTAADSWLAWGAQLEAGAFPTSFIPTTTATVTRAADNLTVPTGSWFNTAEGTGHAMFPDPEASTNRAPFAFSDNTANNRIHPYVTSALSFNIYDSGAFQGIGGAYGTFTQGQSMKVNLAYKANDFAGSYNGSAAVTDTSGTVPAVTQLALGRLTNAGYLSDHIQKFLYYPTRLTNTQLQLLTQ